MKKFSTSLLNSAEVYTSAQRISSIVTTTISNDSFLKRVGFLFKNAINKLASALGRSTDSEAVRFLEEKDKIRNTRFISLRDYVKGFAHDDNAALAEAAASVIAVVRELGWSMYNKGYASKSALMNALIDRLGKDTLSVAIKTLNATSKVEALQKAYDDFEVAFNTKVETKTREVFPLISDSRIAVVRYQAAIMSYTDMMAELDEGEYREAVSKIEEVIVEFASMARARRTRKKHEANKADENLEEI
jgi:hypothetical protein